MKTLALPDIPERGPRPAAQVFLAGLWGFLLREVRSRFGRMRLGYFWAIAEPALEVALFVAINLLLRGRGARIHGVDPVAFFTFAVVSFHIFADAVKAGTGTFSASKGLFNYRQVRPIDLVLARAIIESLQQALVLLAFWIAYNAAYRPLPISDPLLLLTALGLLFAMGVGLGLAFEVFATVFPDLRRVFGIFMRLMFFLSGVFFTIHMIPAARREWVMWNPVFHLLEQVRECFIPGYTTPMGFVLPLVCLVCVWFVALGGYRRYFHHLL